MEQDLFSQTNQTQLLNTTTTDLHQDKEESPTCTDIDMYDHQPRVNLKSESSSFDNSDLISNGQQLSLENQRQNKEPLLDEENKERNQAMIEKNANSSDGTNENEEANEEEEEIKGEGDNDDFVNKNETVDDDDNSEHISVNESDTLKITLEQNENSNKNNDTTKKKLEEENDCVTSRDELTTSVSASIITFIPSDQIINNDMDNTATTSTTINKKDNHNDNPINTDSIIPSPSFSISAGPTTSGKNNLKNNELDKDDNHDDETYNITNYNDNDNNINTSNFNGSNDDVTNTDNNEDNLKDQAGSISLLKGDNNNETNTTAISSEQNTSITNEHDNGINTSADVIHSTPSTFITTNNDNDITITNQQHNEDNKDDVKEDEQDEGTTTPTQINKLESMDQQLLSTFVRDENNINEPSNIPPTTLVDNLPNNGAQSSEQSGNAPEQNTTAILNAQQQDNNNETQVTQIDEHDRNQHYHQSNPSTLSSPLPPPPSQPLLTTSSPPSSELTTTMATATATSTLTISTNTSNDLHHPSDPNNNMNSNNNSSQLQTNNNHQHHQHSITIDQPTPHLLNRTNTYASDEQTLAEPRPRRIWESDRQTSECRKCNRKFNFLVRRHHCRRCGQIFCDRCSSHRIKLPVEEIVEDPMISTSHYPIIALSPQRVCDACIRIPIKADSTSSRYNSSSPSSSSPYGKMVNQLRPAPVNMKRSDSQQSLMAECPVCGTGLLGMRKSQQENHLNQCLNTGSPTVRPPRYIVYTIAEGAAQLGDECPICFEEFQVGHKIARMVCLCSYHKHCLRDWLERGKGCPIHYDSYIQTT